MKTISTKTNNKVEKFANLITKILCATLGIPKMFEDGIITMFRDIESLQTIIPDDLSLEQMDIISQQRVYGDLIKICHNLKVLQKKIPKYIVFLEEKLLEIQGFSEKIDDEVGNDSSLNIKILEDKEVFFVPHKGVC